MKKTLHIIPHSHWDREWYLPFEKHRTRLIDLFDNLIEVMEQNDDYTYYHMDGQYIVIEDYLEVRPSMRERLFALIRAGRIQIGPWYILQDEYLTSGEANVRNMLYGIKLCRAIGAEPVACGYFPDAFGNISQAPQIVRGFGIDNAVFGRGVNDVGADNEVIKQNGVTKSEMIWRGADGSEVIGVMFANWYHNAMELPSDPGALSRRIARIVESTSRFATTDHLLGMNGCDHQPLQKNLHKVIALANEVQNEVTVKQSNFSDYLEAIRENAHDLKVYEGEINGQLGSGEGNLISTASAHIDIKQDNHKAEHLLSGIAEPLSALLHLNGGKYKSDLFLYAWKKLMQNHPHDSICSCSCDEVYDEMKVRFMKAITCTEELRDYALEKLTGNITTKDKDGNHAVVVYSLSPNPARTVVSASIDYDQNETVTAVALFDEKGDEIPAKIDYLPDTFTYTLPEDRFRQPRYVDRFVITFPITTNGIGYRTLTVKTATPTAKTKVKYSDTTLENDTLALKVEDNGTITLTDKRNRHVYENYLLLEDSRDQGELYNYVPVENDTPITSEHSKAAISLFEVTPYSATLKIALSFLDDVTTISYITLTDGIDRVDVKTVVDNRRENHRLRVLFPTKLATDCVFAEGQFDVVKRDIQPAFTWTNPCNCQRMKSFVTLEDRSGDAATMIATRGISEYEVLRDGQNTLAITLLRAVGEVGDWGVFPTPKGQKLGSYTLEYSIIPYDKAGKSEAYHNGYTFSLPAATAYGCESHDGTLPTKTDYLSLDNRFVRASAFKKAEDSDALVLRLFNTSEQAEDVTLTLDTIFKTACRTNLAEEESTPLTIADGKLTLTLGAKKIETILLDK